MFLTKLKDKILIKIYKKFLKTSYKYIVATIEVYGKWINVNDLFIFGGFFSIGYGLWQVSQVLTYTICGGISMLLGLGWLTRRSN